MFFTFFKLYKWYQIAQRITDVSPLPGKFGNTLCRALSGHHAFMGCDYTAAFCRKEKIRPFRRLENNLKSQQVFDRIDLQVKINEDDSTEIGK